MSDSKFKRPPGFDGIKNDLEEQYRAGYQHGANTILAMLRAPNLLTIEQLESWVAIELQKWRHDTSAEPNPPKVK